MITGVTLPELAARIKREKGEKRDFIAPTIELERMGGQIIELPQQTWN